MAPIQMLDCVLKNRNKKEKNLKVFVGDHFNTCRVFPVDDSGSNEETKSKEVVECSSTSSVSETEKSLQIPSSNPNPTSSPIDIKPVPLYNLGQPEKPSRNEIIVGASSLVQIWEARSQQSSSTQSQSLIDSRTSSGLSLSENSYSYSSSFSDSLNNNGYIGSERSNVLDSYEKEREGRSFLQLVTSTRRIRGRYAYTDLLTRIQRDRGKELQEIADLYAVSKFSSLGCGRLQYMLRIRSFERCIAIQERHASKSAASNVNRSSRVKKVYKMANKDEDKNVLQEKRENVKETMEKSSTSGTKDASESVDGLKKLENKKKATGEGSRKAIVKESVEDYKTSLSIAEKVNLWDFNERTYRRKTREKAKTTVLQEAATRVIGMEATERNKEEDCSFVESKSMEIEEYRINTQEDETATHVSRESGKEEKSSLFDEETSKSEKQEESETLCLIHESPRFLNGWDENEMEDEDCSGESVYYYDWISDISRPRSYWEDLRKKREIEVMSKDSKKDDIKGLIKERTVSRILASDTREEIDKILIARTKIRLQVESNLAEEEDSKESLVECSARYQEKLEETESEKVDLETDGLSRYSERSFEEHETVATISLNPKDQDNTSSEIQMICDLREQIKQLQREMIQLQNLVHTCVDFKKSAKLESFSGSISERKCLVCFEMPVNSLLYRCGHMCTCLKCGHELQWSSRKCPICMAPIIDVVRAFLDS